MADRYANGMDCQTCGMHVDDPAEYHPYLFCELYQLGHHDPAAYQESALSGSALLLLPRVAGTNVSRQFKIVERVNA
jgi:hypothetical protein